MSQAGGSNTGGGGSVDSLVIDADSGSASPIGDILFVVGGTNVTTSATGNTLTINASGGSGLTWNVVTSATNPNTIAASNGYIPKGAGQVVFILPAAAAIGDTFEIVGYGNLWQLTQNAGQTIFFGSQATTVGAGGSLTATMIKDRIEILCVTANTEFEVTTSIGNLTVV